MFTRTRWNRTERQASYARRRSHETALPAPIDTQGLESPSKNPEIRSTPIGAQLLVEKRRIQPRGLIARPPNRRSRAIDEFSSLRSGTRDLPELRLLSSSQ